MSGTTSFFVHFIQCCCLWTSHSGYAWSTAVELLDLRLLFVAPIHAYCTKLGTPQMPASKALFYSMLANAACEHKDTVTIHHVGTGWQL